MLTRIMATGNYLGDDLSSGHLRAKEDHNSEQVD